MSALYGRRFLEVRAPSWPPNILRAMRLTRSSVRLAGGVDASNRRSALGNALVNLFNGQRRHRPISTTYDIYFQLAKLATHRPGPRAAPPSHPTAMSGAHAAICRPRGGFAKQKLYKN